MKLLPNASICVQCGRCERICPNNGIFIIDGVPLKCMHCEDAPCKNVCPENAIIKIGDKIVLKKEFCIGCGLCVSACPFGVMRMDYNLKVAFKCNGCIDKDIELCKKVCPTGALEYSEETTNIKRQKVVSKFKRIYSIM